MSCDSYLYLQHDELSLQFPVDRHLLPPQLQLSTPLVNGRLQISDLLLQCLQLQAAFSDGRLLDAHLFMVVKYHLLVLQQLDAAVFK